MNVTDPHLVVQRRKRELWLWSRTEEKFNLVKRYRIAVGMTGLETPGGMYWVTHRDRHPDYVYPDSRWVRDISPALPGTLIPYGDPRNPLAGRWLGLWDGVGIHGTFDDDSIGTAASHGCIRMHEEDVIELFDLVPKGTPVFIY